MKTGKGRRWGVAIFKEEEGRRQGGSTVSEADNIVKSDAAAGEAKSGGWCLEVKDDQRKLGWWSNC
jgi:hypothetical protein